MAVALKQKRKIVVRDRTYYWCVKDDPDVGPPVLHVLSPDKRFIVRYALGQSGLHALGWTQQWQPPFVEVIGAEFGGLPPSGTWRRVRTPAWGGDDGAIKPAFVRRLVEWCLDAKKEVVQVDWWGRIVAADDRQQPPHVEGG